MVPATMNAAYKTVITNEISKTYSVFLVDDDPMVLKMLSRYFTDKQAYKITTFSSGEACLAALEQKPDMVVLDYNLSSEEEISDQVDGIEVLFKIKEQLPDTQVIMLSAQDEVQVAVDCLKRGSTNYIIKDGNMQFSIHKALDTIVKSRELKGEIHELSNTIKRDKLLIRGYSAITIVLTLILYYYWVS